MPLGVTFAMMACRRTMYRVAFHIFKILFSICAYFIDAIVSSFYITAYFMMLFIL